MSNSHRDYIPNRLVELYYIFSSKSGRIDPPWDPLALDVAIAIHIPLCSNSATTPKPLYRLTWLYSERIVT
jgi:hypothetical protein